MQFMDSISRDCDSPSWYFSTGSIAYLQTFGPASNYFISMYFFHLISISICLCNPPVSWKVQPWFTTPSCQKLAVGAIKRLTTQEVWFTSWITYGVSEDSYRSVTFTCHNVSVSLLLIVAELLLCMVMLFSITQSFHFGFQPPQPPKALTSRSKFSRKDTTFQATS